MEQAKKIAECGAWHYIEVANMPTTNDALAFLMSQKHMIVAPPRLLTPAALAFQWRCPRNSGYLSWTAEEVDAQLQKMMINIHKVSARGC